MNSLLVPKFSTAGGPGVYARLPLSDSLCALAKGRERPVAMPIRVLYGDHDWLYQPEACGKAVEKLLSDGDKHLCVLVGVSYATLLLLLYSI